MFCFSLSLEIVHRDVIDGVPGRVGHVADLVEAAEKWNVSGVAALGRHVVGDGEPASECIAWLQWFAWPTVNPEIA
jgi:hypothetical protein